MKLGQFLCESFLQGSQTIKYSSAQGEVVQKFVPGLSERTLKKIASISRTSEALLEKIIQPMMRVPTYSLGSPSKAAASNYYPGIEQITQDEVAAVSKVIDGQSIEPRNTRLRRVSEHGNTVFEVLRASVDVGTKELGQGVWLVQGDHV
jgi:dipeptidyl-peptidase III